MLPEVKSGKIKLVKTNGFGQPALSRNFGRTFAKGDLLCFLDADDEIKPNYIAEAVKLLKKNRDIYIAYSDAIFSKDGYIKAPEYDYAGLIYSNQLMYCSVMRKEVFDTVGGFRDNVRGVEDWDFWIAAGARGFFAKRIPQAFLFYRQKDEGIYEKEVKCNIEEKFANILMNNKEIYDDNAK
jgi:glycosyltransferase involved in cell wall biosynthesis